MKQYRTFGGWLIAAMLFNSFIIASTVFGLVNVILSTGDDRVILIITQIALILVYLYYTFCLIKPSPTRLKHIKAILIIIAAIYALNRVMVGPQLEDATMYYLQSFISIAINYLLWNMYFTRSERVRVYFK